MKNLLPLVVNVTLGMTLTAEERLRGQSRQGSWCEGRRRVGREGEGKGMGRRGKERRGLGRERKGRKGVGREWNEKGRE